MKRMSLVKPFRLAVTTGVIAMTGVATFPMLAQATAPFPSAVKMPAQIAGGRAVTFSVMNKPPASDAAGLKLWTDQVGRFEKAYPNVTINGSEYNYAPDTFAALVAGKQVPTLFQVYLTDPQKYINLGVAADISAIVSANNLSKVYNPDIYNLAINNGKVYGVSDGAYAMGLGYNIPMLKAAGITAPPTTWAEVEADAKKLTDRSKGISGFSFINDGSNAGGWHFTIISYTYGATPASLIAPSANGKYTAGYGTGPTVDALNFIKTLRWTDDVLPHATPGWADNGTLLGTGKAAMVLMAGDQYSWLKNQFKDLDMSTIGFAPIPAGPAGQVSLIGGGLYMVNAAASADEQEAATYFELWRIFDPTEDQISLDARKAGSNPVIGGPNLPLFTGDYEAARVAFEKPYYTLPYDNYAPFLNAISAGKVKLQVEPSPAGQEYYASVGAVVGSVLSDQTVDPAKALADAAQTFQTAQLDTLGQPTAVPTAAATAKS